MADRQQLRGNQLKGQPKCARLKAHGLCERAWWLMRRLRAFTKIDLLNTVATDKDKCADKSVGAYLDALRRAGIVSVDSQKIILPGSSKLSRGVYRYRLVKDLGIQTPVWRRIANQVYDPNTEATFELGPKQRSKTDGKGESNE